MQYLRQNCCPKVIRVVLLSKARARNDTNARVLQQIKSIKNIRGLVRFTGGLYCLKKFSHEDELKLVHLRFPPTFCGILICGKAYMAPWTVLQVKPGIVLSVEATSLALEARLLSTASLSASQES